MFVAGGTNVLFPTCQHKESRCPNVYATSNCVFGDFQCFIAEKDNNVVVWSKLVGTEGGVGEVVGAQIRKRLGLGVPEMVAEYDFFSVEQQRCTVGFGYFDKRRLGMQKIGEKYRNNVFPLFDIVVGYPRRYFTHFRCNALSYSLMPGDFAFG